MNLIDAVVKEIIEITPHTRSDGKKFNFYRVKYTDMGGSGITEVMREEGVELKVGDYFQH